VPRWPARRPVARLPSEAKEHHLRWPRPLTLLTHLPADFERMRRPASSAQRSSPPEGPARQSVRSRVHLPTPRSRTRRATQRYRGEAELKGSARGAPLPVLPRRRAVDPGAARWQPILTSTAASPPPCPSILCRAPKILSSLQLPPPRRRPA
jgi:hypothetical protein